MRPKQNFNNILETLHNGWFLLVFAVGVVYWVARQDSSLTELERADTRITALENRTTIWQKWLKENQLSIFIILI